VYLSLLVVCTLVVSLAFTGCAKKETAEQNPPAGDTTGMAPSTDTSGLTDANIAAIVVAANSSDIKNGEQAKTKAMNAEVKKFAQMMITDHTASNKAATDLATKLNLTPEDNDTSRDLAKDQDDKRSDMASKTGADFDKAYIDNEVDYHEKVLDAIDTKLIPNAQNADLKALLEKTRPVVQHHLDEAKQIQATIEKK
jgi:putative membrane protein